MLARSSVVHSVFAVESAANSLLTKVPRNHHFRDKAELWPILDKIDLYLLARPGSPKIPRDEKIILDFSELIKFRDNHVHPRSARCKVEAPNSEHATFKIVWPGEYSSGLKPVSFIWDQEDAVRALQISTQFLRRVFDLASLTKPQVSAILWGHVVCSDGIRSSTVSHFEKILSLATSLDVDISFVDGKAQQDAAANP